jgi:hypothetical protein
MQPVLLLNQDFAPLHLCRTPRALALVGRGRAEVVAYKGGRTPEQAGMALLRRPRAPSDR